MRQKIDWLLPTTPESLLMLDDPPEGVRPKWLAPGAYGQVLQIDSLGRLQWGPVPGAGDANPMTTQGDLIYGLDAGVPARLGIGPPGYVLTVVGTLPAWRPGAGAVITDPGDLAVGGVTGLPTKLPVGTNGKVLTVASGMPTWVTPAAGGMANPMTAALDLIIGGASGTPTRLPVGSFGQWLTLAGGTIQWAALPVDPGFANPMTTAGDLIRGGTSGAPTRLAAGTDGHVLTLAAGVPGWAAAAAGGMANPMTQAGDLIIGGGPAADPALVNAQSNGAAVNGSSTTTTTLVITPGAGANYLVFVATTVSYFATVPSIVSITASRAGGGAGLTFTPLVNGIGPAAGKKLYVWGSPCVAGAAYTLTITWGGNLDIAQAVMAVSGVGSVGTPVTDVDGGASGNAAVSAGAGNALILDTMTGNSTSVFTPGAGQTAAYAAQTQATIAIRSSVKLGSGTVSVSQSITSPPGDSAYAAVALLPGPAYAAGFPIRLGAGSEAQVLTMLGGVPTWSAAAGVAYPLLAPDGSASAPSYAFASGTNTGWFRGPSGHLVGAQGGSSRLALGSNMSLPSTLPVAWSSGSDPTTGLDTFLVRDGAAGTLAQKNAANAQLFRVYQDATIYLGVRGNRVDFPAGTAPGTPATGYVTVYAKTDKLLYQKDDAGVETVLAGGGGGAAGLTAGRMVFVGAGPVFDDDASLLWDDTGKWIALGSAPALRVMTTTPSALVAGVFQMGPRLSSTKAVLRLMDEYGSKYTIGSDVAAQARMQLEDPSGSGSSITLVVEQFSAGLISGADFAFIVGGDYRWWMTSSVLRPGADNAYDLGEVANRVRSLYTSQRIVEGMVTVTYSTSITIDTALGNHFVITANNATAFTINAPTNPVSGHTIVITIRNTHTGALGTITWNAVFKKPAFTSGATATSRSVSFRYNGTNWVQLWAGAADVPN